MTASLPPLLPDATRDLACFAAGLRYEDLPKAVIERAKLCLLDGIGVCLHGADLPWTRILREVVLAEGGDGRASIWGSGATASLAKAVLVNSTAGHGFEMDDIHKDSVLHPNSIVTPIGLGFAEATGVSGRDLLTAVVAGYEVGTRVGNAATTQLFLNGFHPQGTSGAFVAAATAGRLLGLDAGRMQHALGIAGSLGSGLMAAQEGAMVKRLHAGRAAEAGLQAAQLAERGFTGIPDVLEAGYGGFLSTLSGKPDIARLTEGLGTTWETLAVGYKMYPSVTSIHAALDALKAITRRHGLTAADIARIQAGVGHMTHVHTAWDYKPAGITAAQMNIFFGLATIALHGDATAEAYVEARLQDPDLLRFMQRIEVFEDEAIDARGRAARHACRMEVTAVSGERFIEDVFDRRGSPENPVSAAEIEAKFRTNTRGRLPDAAADRLIALVGRVEALDSLAGITGLLAEAR
ncbi:MmgE/PrpD family protein [Plastoroseomonas hellenica]|uniref:MmgE/PrpD family protein n=1 Tax=Plastoroseomonas hellenica TaxID=2687306 RepID=UPI001BAB4ECF|nr:MmgE/PrpD family protein [Plastoroseomonas hellenica]MBR0642406.1 MmgE/PrpD family protein [Plastoroseomonas hellenica]